jgi:hypothetical protein
VLLQCSRLKKCPSTVADLSLLIGRIRAHARANPVSIPLLRTGYPVVILVVRVNLKQICKRPTKSDVKYRGIRSMAIGLAKIRRYRGQVTRNHTAQPHNGFLIIKISTSLWQCLRLSEYYKVVAMPELKR